MHINLGLHTLGIPYAVTAFLVPVQAWFYQAAVLAAGVCVATRPTRRRHRVLGNGHCTIAADLAATAVASLLCN